MHKHNQRVKQKSEIAYWAARHLQDGAGSAPSAECFERYCRHLRVGAHTFAGQAIADIGCGPVGSLHYFDARLKFGVDVLARGYQPFGIAQHDMIYLAAPVEDLPFVDEFLDAVLSVNALDHVDDFEAALREIHRVLKPTGRALLAFNLDHKPSLTEPQHLTRPRVLAALAGLFEVAETYLDELPEPWRENAPGGVLVIDGRRLPTAPSAYQAYTLDLLQHIQVNQPTQDQLNLEYAIEAHASPQILGELAAANAFQEFMARRAGWGRRCLRAVFVAVRSNPRLLLNRGVLSISLRASASLVGLGTG